MRIPQSFIGIFGTAQIGTTQVGTAQVGTAQVGTAQVGIAQVGTAQVGIAQVGTAQVGTAQFGAFPTILTSCPFCVLIDDCLYFRIGYFFSLQILLYRSYRFLRAPANNGLIALLRKRGYPAFLRLAHHPALLPL